MKTLEHKFVEFIPENIEFGVLYVSMKYKTAIHQCVCGCGNKVVTPISPKFWKINYDGKSISLYPSIGNWNFECRSHYWIKQSVIIAAKDWDERKIKVAPTNPNKEIPNATKKGKKWWQLILFWL